MGEAQFVGDQFIGPAQGGQDSDLLLANREETRARGNGLIRVSVQVGLAVSVRVLAQGPAARDERLTSFYRGGRLFVSGYPVSPSVLLGGSSQARACVRLLRLALGVQDPPVLTNDRIDAWVKIGLRP